MKYHSLIIQKKYDTHYYSTHKKHERKKEDLARKAGEANGTEDR